MDADDSPLTRRCAPRARQESTPRKLGPASAPAAAGRPATWVVSGVLCLPASASADANWGDLLPLLVKVTLLGLPLEIAQFCDGLWALVVGLAVLSWLVGWRWGLDLYPRSLTTLAGFMVFVAVVARLMLPPGAMEHHRFSLDRAFWDSVFGYMWREFTLPLRLPPRPAEQDKPFKLAGMRQWPEVATEFTDAVSRSAQYAGTHALEVDNRLGTGGVYARLCDGDLPACLPIRTMFIPRGASITIGKLAGRSHRLQYRSVKSPDLAAGSRPFTLPGRSPFISAPYGDNPAGDGSFDNGDERVAALIRLPRNVPSFSEKGQMFQRIRVEDF